MTKAKPTVIYNLKQGERAEVPITFEANPAPTEGYWTVAPEEGTVPVAASNVDNTMSSTNFASTVSLGIRVILFSLFCISRDAVNRPIITSRDV